MEIRVSSQTAEPFRAPKRTLGDLDADAASRLIAAASDVALVLDAKGVVRDIAVGNDELSREGFSDWIGQRWIDTVTVESREKIEALLREAGAGEKYRWRQVNHPSSKGKDVPIRYTAVQVGGSGRIVAIGRDLRGMATLQQRLVDAQQSMEREYAKLRQAETRYRLLFQISSEAVLVVDSANDRIVEANPAACKLIGKAAKRLTGKQLHELFNAEGAGKIQAQLASVRASGRADEIRTRLAGAKHDVVVTASMYRQETTAHFLIRLLSPDAAAAADQRQKSSLHDVMQQLPDGFVVTDLDRRILMANQAFLDMVQATAEEQVRSEPIERWLGRHAVDVTVLVKNVRNRGAVRNFASVVRGEYGSQENVEISAVFVDAPEQSCYGFTIRNVIEEADAADNRHPALPRSVEQLTELVGRVALKDLVREATDVIERLCIEAALELTGDNRASAAEMLGLSRQGLYSKLRRHGLGDIGEAR